MCGSLSLKVTEKVSFCMDQSIRNQNQLFFFAILNFSAKILIFPENSFLFNAI